MIQNLIKTTNTKEFYQDCNLKLESYNFKTSDNTLEFIFSINQSSYDKIVEYQEWKITCIKTKSFNRFFNDNLLPNVKMELLDKHPLLLIHQENQLHCEITGKPKNINEFIGEMSNELEQLTGNWITFSQYFWNCTERFEKNLQRTIAIPESLKNPIKSICEKHGLSFKIKEEDKAYSYKSDAKLLIFGNKDISPNDFNFFQPYVIAENFIAERIK